MLLKCPSNDAHCKEIILCKNLKSHLDTCKYWKGTYTCLGCDKIDIISEMENHILTCDQIEFSCSFCDKQIKRAFMGKHLENCDAKLVKCNKCFTSFRGDQIEKHVSKDECLYSILLNMRNTFTGNFIYF